MDSTEGVTASQNNEDLLGTPLLIEMNDWSWRAEVNAGAFNPAKVFFDRYKKVDFSSIISTLAPSEIDPKLSHNERERRSTEAIREHVLRMRKGSQYFGTNVSISGSYETKDRKVAIRDVGEFLDKIDNIHVMYSPPLVSFSAHYDTSRYFWLTGDPDTETKLQTFKKEIGQLIRSTISGQIYELDHPNPSAQLSRQNYKRAASPSVTDLFVNLIERTSGTEPIAERASANPDSKSATKNFIAGLIGVNPIARFATYTTLADTIKTLDFDIASTDIIE